MPHGDKPRPAQAQTGASGRMRREARLAAALRANLGRRKAQERGRAVAEDAPPPHEPK